MGRNCLFFLLFGASIIALSSASPAGPGAYRKKRDIDPIEDENNDIKKRLELIINDPVKYQKFKSCYTSNPINGVLDAIQIRLDFIEDVANEAANDIIAHQRYLTCYEKATT